MMGWRDLPYWLKGGIIGLFLFVVIYPLFVILWLGKIPSTFGEIIVLYAFSQVAFLETLGLCSGEFCTSSSRLALFISIIFTWGLPIVGVLIGYIVGKIKSRGQTFTK